MRRSVAHAVAVVYMLPIAAFGEDDTLTEEVVVTASFTGATESLVKPIHVLSGEDVANYFRPQLTKNKIRATQHNLEPMAFSMYEMGSCMSDNYSYLDQSNEEMSAKGNGGLRQMHSFVTLQHNDKINTPPEDYEPDKVGQVDLGKLQAQRDSEISTPQFNQ